LFAVINAGNTKTGKVAGVKTDYTKQNIGGIILPHHGLAKELISESLDKVSNNNKYSYIVILSPNHFQPIGNTFTTSDKIFDYPLAAEFINKFGERFTNVDLNQDLLEKEHGITLHLPYLEKYYPHAKIVPLIFTNNSSENDILEKTVYLLEKLPDDTLFIASIDFSHETMLEEAMQKNSETIDVISNFNYSSLYGFEDDHLDSPVAMGMFLKIMEKLNATNWQIWHNCHSALIKNDPTLQGTSYVIGIFHSNFAKTVGSSQSADEAKR
jgi:AmmeMemoRadiSam system protein B